jgi:hypothetical protein
MAGQIAREQVWVRKRPLFLKKSGAKNIWSREFAMPMAQMNKVFLVLFLQKKNLLLL